MRLGRNDPCACGSGKKFKRCCLSKEAPSPPPPVSVLDAGRNLAEALAHRRAGRLAEAEALCRRILAAQPGNAPALHLAGGLAIEAGRFDDAVEALEAAARLYRSAPAIYGDLAAAYRGQGRLPEAILAHASALSLKSDLSGACDGLRGLLDREGIATVEITILHYIRIGELGLVPDLYFRQGQLNGRPADRLRIFVSGEKPANRQLLEMLKRHVAVVESDLLLFGLNRWIPPLSGMKQRIEVSLDEPRVKGFQVGGHKVINVLAERYSNEHPDYQSTRSTLRFTAEEENKGRRSLRKMGIDPERDRYVCLFARDPAYLTQLLPERIHDHYRNADIDSYRPAIDHILAKGGFVVRMGSEVSGPLVHESDRAIDYATQCRDDFMDIYLMAKCRFVLGTTSGICDVAMLFDVPRIGTNWTPLGSAPLNRDCLFIPKKLKSRQSGDYVPLADFLTRTKDFHSPLLWSLDIMDDHEYEDNDPNDILAVTIEMIERLEGTFAESAADTALQERYFRQFPPDHWSAQVKTPIGRAFLRENRILLLGAQAE